MSAETMTAAAPAYGQEAYVSKRADYSDLPRRDYVDALPANPSAAILEVGCCRGATGRLALQSGKCANYVGIEISPSFAEVARKVLTSVYVGNIEQMELPFAPQSFDALILSEVLEHLVDPWAVLSRLVALLKPGGLVMASAPNVASTNVIRALLANKFDYVPEGMMDITHVRWFTPRTFGQMFENAGLEILKLGSPRPLTPRRAILNRLTFGRLNHLFYDHISAICRKPDQSR
jgi:2-polyprenyl-3-methyl-5-hydroxy-6-metoxy-1,4-benzoquinol methylase